MPSRSSSATFCSEGKQVLRMGALLVAVVPTRRWTMPMNTERAHQASLARATRATFPATSFLAILLPILLVLLPILPLLFPLATAATCWPEAVIVSLTMRGPARKLAPPASHCTVRRGRSASLQVSSNARMHVSFTPAAVCEASDHQMIFLRSLCVAAFVQAASTGSEGTAWEMLTWTDHVDLTSVIS